MNREYTVWPVINYLQVEIVLSNVSFVPAFYED